VSAIYRDGDVRVLTMILHPEYVVRAARELGLGNAVVGSEAVVLEIKQMIISVVRGIVARHRLRMRRDPEFRNEVREFVSGLRGAVKHLISMGQRVEPFESSEWRKMAAVTGPPNEPWPIFGDFEVPIPGHVPDDYLGRAVIRATSEMLAEHPEWNRAFLECEVWQRTSPEVLVYVEPWPEIIMGAVVNGAHRTDRDVRMQILAYIKAVKRGKGELTPVFNFLAADWLKHSAIASAGGATLSILLGTGMYRGHGPIVRANGIPIALVVGDRHYGSVNVGVTLDHRCFDGRQGGNIHACLREKTMKLCADYAPELN
jgi:hypothetical protein